MLNQKLVELAGRLGLTAFVMEQVVAEALRPQADARPAGHFFKASRVHPWVQVEKGCPNAVPLYIHPEASSPGLSEDEWLALAERHIRADWNSEQPDGYLNAVKALVQDAMSLTRASAATVGEPNARRPLTADEVAAQYDEQGIHIGSGLPAETCPCGLCKKVRESAQQQAEPGAVEWRIPMHLLDGVERGRHMKLSADAMLDKDGNLIIGTPLLEYSGFQSAQAATIAEPSEYVKAFDAGRKSVLMWIDPSIKAEIEAAQQQAEPGADEQRKLALRMARQALIDNDLTPDKLPRVFDIIDEALAAQSGQRAGPYPTLRLCRQDGQASDVFIHAVRRDEATGFFDVSVSTSEERNGQRAGVAEEAATRLYLALKDLLASVDTRPNCCGIAPITIKAAVNALRFSAGVVLAAAPTQQQQKQD